MPGDILAVSFAVVGAILLIGCVNLAALLLVRTSARRQEITLRVTMGASRARVVRQLLTEILLLALVGGIGGAVLAWWGKDFMAWLPSRETPIVDARLDLRVLVFTAVLSTLAALLFGIGPALRATRPDLAASLRTSAQRGGRVRGFASQALLAAEVAATLVLLVGAGLLLRTLYNFSRVDVGFNADNVLVFRMDPGPQGETSSRLFDTYDRIMTGIEAVPGVQSCTMSAMPSSRRASGRKPSNQMALAIRGARSSRWPAGTSSRRWAFRWWRAGISRRQTAKDVLVWPSSTRRWHGRCSGSGRRWGGPSSSRLAPTATCRSR